MRHDKLKKWLRFSGTANPRKGDFKEWEVNRKLDEPSQLSVSGLLSVPSERGAAPQAAVGDDG